MNRKKLTIAEQISDMHQKGITFHYTEEQDVSRFLKYNNYYFNLSRIRFLYARTIFT